MQLWFVLLKMIVVEEKLKSLVVVRQKMFFVDVKT
jgi:hypothetical protein